MKSFLMRLARKVLDSVLQQLMQQFNVIQEQALAPIKQILGMVDGVWRGNGATQFKDELLNLMTPEVTRIGTGITNYHKNLTKARDLIDRADSTARNLVNSKLRSIAKFY
ncbi:MAG TPA: hypothetical protein DEF47_15375 [Herpetosiphon sp.]|uniref:Uncharacterized protein n=2 Tax=Herpetosiphon TaxID=64 RepID=A9B0A7_HERA2|nr:hypothetical protein [Herpetosiphon sp.]ABX05216.1 hypothetical protein Haur_2578 [Herpetosiphon aurantiacus DSM 785]HBW51274.1 hypothetical protein [Herpetosiphon sp.]